MAIVCSVWVGSSGCWFLLGVVRETFVVLYNCVLVMRDEFGLRFGAGILGCLKRCLGCVVLVATLNCRAMPYGFTTSVEHTAATKHTHTHTIGAQTHIDTHTHRHKHTQTQTQTHTPPDPNVKCTEACKPIPPGREYPNAGDHKP